MSRINEIETRLAAIRVEAENENADIDALQQETTALLEERRLIGEKAERRKQLISSISGMPGGTPVIPKEPEERAFDSATVLSTPEYRSAFAKKLMGLKLDKVEQRALNTALTTTATTFVAGSADADGVNNAGLFIPETVLTDLVKRIELQSPIFRDIAKTAIRGTVNFPYEVESAGVTEKVEGEENKDISVQWAEISLGGSEISDTLKITWKAESMTVDGFMTYLTDMLVEKMQDRLIERVIYGTGANGGVTGIANASPIDGDYASSAKPLQAIKAGLAKMGKKRKIGAKIYLSSTMHEELIFETNNDGDYQNNPVNGMGISTIAGYPVEVDPYLTDGDIVIGNLSRYYRFNWNEQISITRDVSGIKRASYYTPYAIVGGNAQPQTILHGEKKA